MLFEHVLRIERISQLTEAKPGVVVDVESARQCTSFLGVDASGHHRINSPFERDLSKQPPSRPMADTPSLVGDLEASTWRLIGKNVSSKTDYIIK